MKATVILMIGVFLVAVLLLFRFSPHGGIVPIWKDTANAPKMGGGNGTSFKDAVTITGHGRELAKNYEIYFLWKLGHKGIEFTNYNSITIVTNEQTYHVINIDGKEFYFNITELK